MSSNESSGAPAEATATPPAPSAEFPTFGTTRGSGLARGKRPSAGPAAATAAAQSDYKPTAIEVVNAPREYTNPFAPAEPVAAAPVVAPAAAAPVAAPVVVPATPVRASSPVAADLATFSSAQVDAPAPIAQEPAELNILPPAEQKSTPAQTWESDGFRPTRENRSERPRREERQDEPAAAASEEVDVDAIPAKFLYVRPGVKFVPTPRNWGGAPRERSERSNAVAGGAPSPAPVARSESPRSPAPAAAKSGGFLGWLKSLFGGESAAAPVAVAQDNSEQHDGGERRQRGGRSRGGRGPGGGEGGGQRRHRGGRNRHRSGGESEGTRQGGI
jgi:translation initiation factor IF-2